MTRVNSKLPETKPIPWSTLSRKFNILDPVEQLKIRLRNAIRNDDFDEVDRLLDIKRPRVQAVALHKILKTRSRPFTVRKRR